MEEISSASFWATWVCIDAFGRPYNIAGAGLSGGARRIPRVLALLRDGRPDTPPEYRAMEQPQRGLRQVITISPRPTQPASFAEVPKKEAEDIFDISKDK